MLTYAINFLIWHAFHHLVCISPRYADTPLWTQELICPQTAISSHQIAENCECAQANAASIWADIAQRSWTEKYKGRLSSISRIFHAWHYKKYFNCSDYEHKLKRFISLLSEDAGSILFWGKKRCSSNVTMLRKHLFYQIMTKEAPRLLYLCFVIGFYVFQSLLMNVKSCLVKGT